MSKTLKTAIPFIILVVFAGTSIAPLLSANSLKNLGTDFEGTAFLATPVTGETMGSATRIYKENTYSLTLTSNLATPTEGTHYESWIARLNPFKITDIGQMALSDSGTYDLTYTESNTETDFEEFSTVIVTEESDTEPATTPSETHILEGTF